MSSALHIIVQYVRFKGGIIKPKDDIRISLTSLPSHGKDHFTTPASKLSNINHEFVINCDLSTQQILILLRRKSYINGDPILGGNKLNVSQIPHDKPLDMAINLEELLTVNDGGHIRKTCGTIGIKAFYDEDGSVVAPHQPNPNLEPTPHFEPVPHFQPAPHFDQTAQNSNGIRPSGSGIMAQPPPHHTRRKSLMPKWKKNNEYNGFDDSHVSQPLTNCRDGIAFQDPM